MDGYNLAPGEFVITQEQSWYLWDEGDEEQLKELALSNKNLILVMDVQQGMFKRTTMLKRCPLVHMIDAQGAPALMVSKLKNRWWLQISFGDEVIRVRDQAGTRTGAERWADSLRKAALGDYASISTDGALPPEVAQIVDGARGLFGTIAGSVGARSKGAQDTSKAPAMVSTPCVGCHAPLSGRKGSIVTCPYCDTKQTL